MKQSEMSKQRKQQKKTSLGNVERDLFLPLQIVCYRSAVDLYSKFVLDYVFKPNMSHME